jgi:hypothetical protein
MKAPTPMTWFTVFCVLIWIFQYKLGGHRGCVRMIVGLQLPMQSMHITTNVVSPNSAQQVCGFLRCLNLHWVRFRVMVLNSTFNNISVISWRSVFLLVEKTGVPGENHRPAERNLDSQHIYYDTCVDIISVLMRFDGAPSFYAIFQHTCELYKHIPFKLCST